MNALAGEHLCKEHQGNAAHYASHNCTICKAEELIKRLEHDLADAHIRINDLETEVVTLRANA